MTSSPIVIDAQDTLEHAVRLMDRNTIKRLVVADAQRRVRGIVSCRDLVKLFAMKWRRDAKGW